MALLYIFLILGIVSQTFSQTVPPPNIVQQQYFTSNNIIGKSPNYGHNQLAKNAVQKPAVNYGGDKLANNALPNPFPNYGIDGLASNLIKYPVPNYGFDEMASNTMKNPVPNYADNQLPGEIIQKPVSNYGGDLMDETDLNSPYLSQFAAYNLKAQKEAGIYPRLFDISFSPEDLSENIYNEVVYFALDMGLYEVGTLAQQVADAAVQALPNSSPLQFFKIMSNTLELALEHEGILTEGNYKVLARINAKALQDAMDLLKVNDARTALHAIMVGAKTFFKLLSISDPDDIKYITATFADQLWKASTAQDTY